MKTTLYWGAPAAGLAFALVAMLSGTSSLFLIAACFGVLAAFSRFLPGDYSSVSFGILWLIIAGMWLGLYFS